MPPTKKIVPVKAEPMAERFREQFTRVLTVMNWLAQCPPRQCSLKVMREFGVTRDVSDRYVATATALMRRDNDSEPIESKRARMIASLEHIADRAMKNTRTYTNKDGETVDYASPDYRGAIAAKALIADIEGLRRGST